MIIIDGTAVQKVTAKLRVDSQMHYCWKQERLGEWEPQTSPGAPSAWQCLCLSMKMAMNLFVGGPGSVFLIRKHDRTRAPTV